MVIVIFTGPRPLFRPGGGIFIGELGPGVMRGVRFFKVLLFSVSTTVVGYLRARTG